MLVLLGATTLAACAAIPPTPFYTARFAEPIPHYYRYSSGLDQPTNLVVRDWPTWNTLWNEITRRHGQPPAAPHVDFGSEMLLVAAMGTQPSGGYAITIEQVVETPASLDAYVVRTSPGPRCGATAALTQPVDIVRVPTLPKPVIWSVSDVFTDCP
jgi:hypothetical protein